MTLADINTKVTMLTSAAVTDYTYQQRTINLNQWYYRVQNWILQSQDEWDFDDINATDFPVATTALVANQNDYTFPDGLLKIKRVEVKYDGSTWYKANPIDIPTTTQSASQATYSEAYPYYDTMGRSVILYPTPASNQTAALKIWYDRTVSTFAYTSEAANDILTGTKIPGFDATFHDILALGVAHEWKFAKLGDNSLLAEINRLQSDLMKHYSQKQKDRQMSLQPMYVNYE